MTDLTETHEKAENTKCPKCHGTDVEDGWYLYCENCGNTWQDDSASSEPTETRSWVAKGERKEATHTETAAEVLAKVKLPPYSDRLWSR